MSSNTIILYSVNETLLLMLSLITNRFLQLLFLFLEEAYSRFQILIFKNKLRHIRKSLYLMRTFREGGVDLRGLSTFLSCNKFLNFCK